MILSRLRRGDLLKGTMLRVTRNPAVAAIAKLAGLDFIMLDMEHGAYSFGTLSDMATAAEHSQLAILVRVSELARGYVSRALDCGADGVMVPMVEDVEQARALARWAKYPPRGVRGLSSIGGNTGYAKVHSLPGLMAQSNSETLTIAQIETKTAREHIDGIAAEKKGTGSILFGTRFAAG